MVAETRSQVSSEREKWHKIFNGVVKLVKNQEQQLQTLLEERKILQERLKMQHERWVSDVRFFEQYISQLDDELAEKEIACSVEAAKSDLLAGLKSREAAIDIWKLAQAEDELADFRAWFDSFCQDQEKNSIESGKGKGVTSAGSKKLESEIKRLKLEYEKLASEKGSEVSALLKEKSFVWNQYNLLESNLTNKLKSKQAEVDLANEKIAKVLETVEGLQSSNNEKDGIIRGLKAKVAEMEVDTRRRKEEISKLSQELELLKKSINAQVTPVLGRCNTGSKTSTQKVKSSGRNQTDIGIKKESSSVQVAVSSKEAQKGSRSLKRKEPEVIAVEGTPKLFSSTFKVPKLKTLPR